MKIWIEPAKCRGCVRCELACSFFLSGSVTFNPELSATKIYRDNENKRIRMTLDDTCNYCKGEDIPLCVKACVFGARGVVK